MPDVTLLYFDGCPNWEVARGRIGEALSRLASETPISLQPVETPESADRLNFRGSPTILIDGVDPFAEANAATGLSCRVYMTEDGMDGSPSVDQLVAALRERP